MQCSCSAQLQGLTASACSVLVVHSYKAWLQVMQCSCSAQLQGLAASACSVLDVRSYKAWLQVHAVFL